MLRPGSIAPRASSLGRVSLVLLLLSLARAPGGARAQAVGQEGLPDLDATGVRMRIVDLKPPMRVGYGEGARQIDRGLSVEVTVRPYDEADLEPFLYIGDTEVRGHEVQRGQRAFTLIYLVPDLDRLRDGAPLLVSLQHDRARSDPRFRESSEFRFRWKDIDWGGRLAPPRGAFEEARPVFADPQGRRTRTLEPGDPIAVGLEGGPAGAGVEFFVLDDEGREWSYARLFTDARGQIEPTPIWFHTGVLGTSSLNPAWRPKPAFASFEEAENYLAQHRFVLEVRIPRGEVIHRATLPIAPRRLTPQVYPSDEDGTLVNAFNARGDDVWVSGRHFPAGSIVDLFLVPNQRAWTPGDPLHDVGAGGDAPGRAVQLKPDQTSFAVRVLAKGQGRPGAYDIVARLRDPDRPRLPPDRLRETDIVSYGPDTALLLFAIINGNIVIDCAGRMRDAPAKFEFSDAFERHEPVHGAVDPTDVPAAHPGGNYAAYYVVGHQPDSYWDGPSPALIDVTEGVEIMRVKYWCINVSRAVIWNDPDPPGLVGEYDVIVDFGATPAMAAADFVADNTYAKGLDFLDGYGQPGFTVLDDPASPGPTPVGSGDHYDDSMASPPGPNDPFSFPALSFPLVRNWFTIRYPAGVGGPGASLPPGVARYPVVLVLHGRHPICSGVAWANRYDTACAGQKIPSHKGYDYLLDVLASHGMIAISIDAYDIQPSNGTSNYEARARLVLEHLNRLRDWDLNGTDPFGGIFHNRIDMARIGLMGHSRGGEGVVAASVINIAEAATYGHSILAVAGLGPTDQQSTTPWNIAAAPYLLLAGAADGDVSNQQGFRTYDRAFPTGAASQHDKSAAWIHGANHNYFNTIWTPTPPLAVPHGFDWAGDDGAIWTGPRITDAEQRQIGLVTLVAFYRWHLQGIAPYREVFTGRLPMASMRNDMMHWSYQDPVRLVVDDFEQAPHAGGLSTNTLGESVAVSGVLPVTDEIELRSFNGFFHDTWGARLGWNGNGRYTSHLPAALQDVSPYTHLAFRVSQIIDGGVANPVGQPKNIMVNVEDTDGDQAMWDLHTDDFTPIPYPYLRTSTTGQFQLKTVRIPLRNFTMNNSGVDLDRITKVEIILQGAGLVGIDDLQITK